MAGFTPGGFAPTAARTALQTGQFNPTGLGLPTNVVKGYTPGVPTQQQTAVDLIKGTPGYVSEENNSQLALGQGNADRAAGIQGAYADYGGPLPAGFHDQYGDLSPSLIQEGSSDPYNQYNQFQRQQGEDLTRMRQQEAANGSIFSSQARTDAGDYDNQYGMGLRTLGGNFLDAVNGALGKFTGVIQKNSADRANATLQGQNDLSKDPTFTGVLGHKPHLVPPIGF